MVDHTKLQDVDFSTLKADLELELNERGNRWKTYVVWVQKLGD